MPWSRYRTQRRAVLPTGNSAQSRSAGLSRVEIWLMRICALGPLTLACLPFGSRDLLWPAVWTIPLAVCVLIGMRLQFTAQESRLIGLMLMGCALLLVVLALQQGLAGAPPHRAWARTSAVLHEELAAMPRVAAAFPLEDLVRMQVPVLAMIAGLCLSRLMPDTRDVLLGIVLGGAGYALFWIILFIADPEMILWRPKTGHLGNLTGTFTNRNAAAAFLAVPLVCAALLIADFVERTYLRSGASLRTLASAVMRRTPPRLIILVFAAGLIAAALLLTSSRAGISLGIATAILAAGLRMRQRLKQRGNLRYLMLGVSILAVGAFLLIGASLETRFVDSREVDIDRFQAYAAMLLIVRDHAFLGVGFGQFAEVFPQFRPPTVSPRGIWETAHNTYLQVLIEGGVLALIAVLVPVAYVLSLFMRSVVYLNAGRLAPVAGLSVLLMPTLHAMVDFQVQTAGYTIPMLMIVGLLFARSQAASASSQPMSDNNNPKV